MNELQDALALWQTALQYRAKEEDLYELDAPSERNPSRVLDAVWAEEQAWQRVVVLRGRLIDAV